MAGKPEKRRLRPGLAPIRVETTQTDNSRPPGDLDNKAILSISGKGDFVVKAEDLRDIAELGKGAYGVVSKVIHVPSSTTMAVKRIRAQVNKLEDKRILMDMDVAMRSWGCPWTVEFYGALFQEGDVLICMEVMDTCLGKFQTKIKAMDTFIPENILSRIAFSIVNALHYLQKELKVMHRDVKPSNVLVNRNGMIKMCDFGISGRLVDSVAKTIEAGSKPYMAPERIDPEITGNAKGYDVKSDVWSLGITMFELTTNEFPYEKWGTPFAQLKQVVKEPSPKLPEGKFSPELEDFVDQCLKKNCSERPTYTRLLRHSFITNHDGVNETDVATFVTGVLGATPTSDATVS
ncbi:dual specificity mitogen-activated protein kinase kinase 6-like [Acanthaster planci]|uniref:mitogen-activated protein kinase kinase n=1 Tax=Acanthaster planci TaxID=133434 RepID=A0A8B7YIX4_ACAPL|nr:dual specificity mitogen-activated protein kinase kinase 6-like [Acanthaster planci]